MALYPVNLDVRGMPCLVVGGGHVASRKVDSLLPCGAIIRVISPEVCPHLEDLARSELLEWQKKKYATGDLGDARLVFAATDSPVIQKQIVAAAKAAGVLVNVADMPDACTFQVPASFRQGKLLFTVATGGGSPAFAARIKRELAALYGPEYGLFVAMMSDIRRRVVASSDSPVAHKRIFEKLLDSDILEHIRKERWNEISMLLQHILPTEIDVSLLVKNIQNFNKEQIP
ncbi:precorrin-2 dehydrogenase [Desulfocapsa sulfexigens DSM 10523]|uniref:precorrin-2 dehydrogenase n=1 Tax=Desulfocapsa sulfexigens (strain DSM 10523 / SB164P1) TaxID=1167006 RepID=M1P0J8_DESSD|nr:bifunctional precorrin-2 dehydrogenase/sirohydrochlorin ferrochelatase [Desulfocapsa sulfexigens]AGF77013.1 precorrin-2 dehydrogenase [Desulfocapsa sulfexigens DSM 10523]